MNEDINQEEVGLVTCRREGKWVLGNIYSQNMIYADVVQLHKVHK